MGHRDRTTVPVFSRYSKLRVFLFGRIKVMEIGCRCITTHAEESQSFASEADYIIANMDKGQFFRIITDCFNKSV